MSPLHLLVFILSVFVGVGVIHANPRRPLNRALAVLSLNISVWVVCLAWLMAPDNRNHLLWLKITSCVSTVLPFMLWRTKVVAETGLPIRNTAKYWVFLGLTVVIALECLTQFFVPNSSTSEHRIFGVGWYLYIAFNSLAFVFLFVTAVASSRAVSGLQKIELQTLVMGAAPLGVGSQCALLFAKIVGGLPSLDQQLSVLALIFYVLIAWAITTRKILDAQHLLLAGVRLGVMTGMMALMFYGGLHIHADWFPEWLVALVCSLSVLGFYDITNNAFGRLKIAIGGRKLDDTRNKLVACSTDEYDRDRLAGKYAGVLAGWAGVSGVEFLFLNQDSYRGVKAALPLKDAGTTRLLCMKWATAESLIRQRASAPGHDQLVSFFANFELGALVCAPSHGAELPSFIVAFTQRETRLPFTWTEVERVLDWCVTIENAFSKLSLTQKIRDSEQLKTLGLLGACLAHEIRNPLVSVKLLAQSAEYRYKDPEFLRLLSEVVPKEIERIESLVNGLMDLGRPQELHIERLHLNEVVEASLKLVRTKALKVGVTLNSKLAASPDEFDGDRGSLRQIVLNLVMNAIQVFGPDQVIREIHVETSVANERIVLDVRDNGPGIPEAIRSRLFQPFATSNKSNGMGLGLAITADLVGLHHGTIEALTNVHGFTTFRVTLPLVHPVPKKAAALTSSL